MDRKPIEKLKAVPKFDPTKSYQWDPNDHFTISGAELDAWYKGLTVMAATQEFQRFVHLQRALIVMNDFIKDGVEQDLIFPVPAESETLKTDSSGELIETNISQEKEIDGQAQSVNG